MSSGALWLVLIVAGVAAVLIFGYMHKRRLTMGREAIELMVIHGQVADQVSFEVLRDVLSQIGHAYSIDPRMIRPEDALERFSDTDSWMLDAGTERLNKWLIENGLEDSPTSAKTVLDLALLIQECRKAKDNESPRSF
jgi:hypothetical protein